MKITEEYLENLPIGSKIELKNEYGEEKTVIKFAQVLFIANLNYIDTWNIYKIIDSGEITKIEIPSYTVEYKSVLNNKEKEYLSSVIKPFRDKILYISKERYFENESENEYEYIAAAIKNEELDTEEYIIFPRFELNTMYESMESEKEYTLEELEI